MPTQRWESRALVAEVRWRRLALGCLVHVHSGVVANCAGLVASRLIKNRSDRVYSFAGTRGPSRHQCASMDVCDRKRGGCGAIMNYVHSAASIAHKEAKARMKGKKKEVTTISQRAAQIVEGACAKEKEDVACPRCDRELYVFNTASGPILRCRGWTLAGTPCTLIKACHNGVIVPGGLQNTNRTGGGNSASGSGGPGTLPRRDDGVPNPPLLNDWTAQVQALAANPAWAQEQFAQWQLFHQQYQHLQYQQAAHGGVDDGSLASASRGRRIHWGPVEYGHGNGSDWCVIAQSNTTSEREDVNHQQDKSSNARFNGKKKNEPVLTASLVLKEHPFEIKQENEVPEFAAAIRERGIWSRHRSLAVFFFLSSARDRSCEFNVFGSRHIAWRCYRASVKLDDGSYLNVLDDSDLADFIHHHAWFEGDEVALPREDRVYLLGNLTGQTPKKRRVTQSRSDLKELNAACSFPIETEQHELDPDCNGADEMGDRRNAS